MFEVTYLYHAKDENGKYNTEETKVLTKKVGQAYEEVSYDQLASVIIGQLARRDIWIVDVKIYEYTKKEITFKEATDGSGIVIKNKKYVLNGSVEALPTVIDLVEPNVGTALAPVQPINPKPQNLANIVQSKPIMFVTFEPNIQDEIEVKKHKLTKGKRYAVYNMVETKVGMTSIQKYTIKDDLNRDIKIDEKYFTVVGKGLYGDKELGFSTPVDGGPKLSYSDAYISDSRPVQRQAVQRQKPAQYANIPFEGESIDHLLDDKIDLEEIIINISGKDILISRYSISSSSLSC